eukprot:SAG31_NODE_992_length_10517_cov_6.577942_2_plen_146_part_00
MFGCRMVFILPSACSAAAILTSSSGVLRLGTSKTKTETWALSAELTPSCSFQIGCVKDSTGFPIVNGSELVALFTNAVNELNMLVGQSGTPIQLQPIKMVLSLAQCPIRRADSHTSRTGRRGAEHISGGYGGAWRGGHRSVGRYA